MLQVSKTIAIIQARMGSTRLPGKVMEDLAGQPMLARVVNRTCRAQTLGKVVVVTTTQPADDAVISLCKERGWLFYRGSEEDVLDRYYQTALAFKAEVIVRITSDCPLIDPGLIAAVVQDFLYRDPEVDYATSTLIRTFPRGLDVEVMSFDALERAWRECIIPTWREHVTQYIVRHPEKFTSRNVANDVDYSWMRWTVDVPEDLALVRQIYSYFRDDTFNWRDVLELLKAHPELLEINRHIQQKTT